NDRVGRVRGARHPDLGLDIVTLPLALGAERLAGFVDRGLKLDLEGPIEPLRVPILDWNRAVNPVPRSRKASRNRFGHIDAGVAVDGDRRVEPLDREAPFLAGYRTRCQAHQQDEARPRRRNHRLTPGTARSAVSAPKNSRGRTLTRFATRFEGNWAI